MMSLGNQPVPQRSFDLRFVAAAAAGFVAGVIITLLVSAWVQSGRTETIAALTEQVEQMQAQASRAVPAQELSLPSLQASTQLDPRVANAIAVVQQSSGHTEVAPVLEVPEVPEATEVSAEAPVIDAEPDPDTTAAEIELLLQDVSADEEERAPPQTDVARPRASAQAQAVLAAIRRNAFAASYVPTIPAPAPDPVSASAPLVYTVTEGDSLATIALAFYGDTDEYIRLFEANRNLLDTPDQIEAGQQLIIPEVQ